MKYFPPRIVWLVLAIVLLFGAATGPFVWIPYLRVQRLSAEVERHGGTLLTARVDPECMDDVASCDSPPAWEVDAEFIIGWEPIGCCLFDFTLP